MPSIFRHHPHGIHLSAQASFCPMVFNRSPRPASPREPKDTGKTWRAKDRTPHGSKSFALHLSPSPHRYSSFCPSIFLPDGFHPLASPLHLHEHQKTPAKHGGPKTERFTDRSSFAHHLSPSSPWYSSFCPSIFLPALNSPSDHNRSSGLSTPLAPWRETCV